MRRLTARIYWYFLALLTASSLAADCPAQEIYKWVDGKGHSHFSTEPLLEDQLPAKLPEVQRQDLNGKIKEIKENTPTNCLEHGNVDCSRGADTDGSVICLDGFRDAVLPFRFACLECKLTLEKAAVLGPDGKEAPWPLPGYPFGKGLVLSVPIRNSSPVQAENVTVTIRGKTQVQLAGPSRIEPYGLADFTLPADMLSLQWPERTASIKAICTNCRSAVTGKLKPSNK